jgi:hypothetical protein
MKLKIIDGVLYFTADYSTPRGYQLAAKIERFTRKYLKFFLGVALVVVVLAWMSMMQDIRRTVEFAQFLQQQQL